jgi:hypothetical protein
MIQNIDNTETTKLQMPNQATSNIYLDKLTNHIFESKGE